MYIPSQPSTAITIRWVKKHPDAVVPQSAHADDVGADLCFVHFEKLSDNLFMLESGLSVEPPPGYYLELHARSGIIHTGFIQANQVGIIDPNYRGVIKMPVRYVANGDAEAAVQAVIGKRFAQLIVRRQIRFSFEAAAELSSTQRGVGGFGSSGN